VGEQQHEGVSLSDGPLVREDEERRVPERVGCDCQGQSCGPWEGLQPVRSDRGAAPGRTGRGAPLNPTNRVRNGDEHASDDGGAVCADAGGGMV
jgi:hypothetical protein